MIVVADPPDKPMYRYLCDYVFFVSDQCPEKNLGSTLSWTPKVLAIKKIAILVYSSLGILQCWVPKEVEEL